MNVCKRKNPQNFVYTNPTIKRGVEHTTKFLFECSEGSKNNKKRVLFGYIVAGYFFQFTINFVLVINRDKLQTFTFGSLG